MSSMFFTCYVPIAILCTPQDTDGLISILDIGQKHHSVEKYEKCVNWKTGIKMETRASQSVQG